MALVWGGLAGAEAEPAQRANGREAFMMHCAVCHGRDAHGGGPVAEYLVTAPPDLTRIAERREGTFERKAIAAFIDGRERVGPHGSPEMPIWGGRQRGGPDDGTLLPETIEAIVVYLESIQAKPRD